VWERAEAFSALFREGDVLEVAGQSSVYRNQIQLTLSNLKVPQDKGDPALFLETTPRDIGEMMGALRKILRGIKSPPLHSLVERFLSDRHLMSLFKRAPAAKNFHHSYLGGLLEHTLSVCQMCQHVRGHYGELDGDMLISGAFLHDIGKIKELKFDYQIDYTDEGRLLGHVILGATLLEEKLEDLKRTLQS